MILESRNRKNKKHNPHGPRGERCSPTPTRFNQPDPSTRHPPVLTWLLRLYRLDPPLCLVLLYYLITLCIHLSTVPRLHSLRHPTGRLRPFRRYANTAWPCPISSPVRSHSVPHVNQGRASRPEVDERAARFNRWCASPAQRCSTSLFLHAGVNRIARLIVFRLQASTAFSCLIDLSNWLFSSIVGHSL